MNKLDYFRNEINIIDEQLMKLLGQRFTICSEVAEHKKEEGIPMMQPDRIEAVKQRCCLLGQQFGVDSNFTNNIYSLIIEEACRLENIIIDKQNENV